MRVWRVTASWVSGFGFWVQEVDAGMRAGTLYWKVRMTRQHPKTQTLNPKPVDTHTEADSRALVQSTVPLLTFWFWINLCVYAESIKLQRTQSPVRYIPKREMRYTRFRLKAQPRARVVGMFGWILCLARKSPPGLGFWV